MTRCWRQSIGVAALVLGIGSALGPGEISAASASPSLANVACAGSLQLLMDQYLGPAFARSTGDQYQGEAAGSLGLAQEILAGELHPNVFVPVGQAAMALLQPKFTNWAVRFAASPLVLAYYPGGSHAAELKKIAQGKLPIVDLFTLMATPGFRLGRTDPAVDPQGQAFEMMVRLAEKHLQVSRTIGTADLGGPDSASQIFSETSLEPTLQAGQLDAASAFLPQAIQLHLPYVTLPSSIDFGDPADAHAYAQVSLTIAPGQTVHGSLLDLEASVLKGADQRAAEAFVSFLLTAEGRRILQHEGYQLLRPSLLGKVSAVPKEVRETAAKA